MYYFCYFQTKYHKLLKFLRSFAFSNLSDISTKSELSIHFPYPLNSYCPSFFLFFFSFYTVLMGKEMFITFRAFYVSVFLTGSWGTSKTLCFYCSKHLLLKEKKVCFFIFCLAFSVLNPNCKYRLTSYVLETNKVEICIGKFILLI